MLRSHIPKFEYWSSPPQQCPRLQPSSLFPNHPQQWQWIVTALFCHPILEHDPETIGTKDRCTQVFPIFSGLRKLQKYPHGMASAVVQLEMFHNGRWAHKVPDISSHVLDARRLEHKAPLCFHRQVYLEA